MIRVLEKAVADKIAAGEVIDRPVSIVKELVENSLDADADTITVEMKKGGKEYLRITDNGCGITAEDVELAFRRHATSKIETENDLDAIRSLGFRGEALASICAVARVDMITRPAEAHTGRHVICEGSDILKNAPTGCPEGTTITVRDLFYNLPARKKFLGTDGAEARRIIDLMSRIALAYPDVRFRLINSRQEVFHTSGQGSILDNICRIYGRDMGRDLVKVDASRDGFLLRGFVSSPGTSVTSRSRQFFCVNGRTVSSKTMERGLEKAYRERLFPGRFPVAFLFLQLPAEQLDVNVHPTKKEIRFDDDFSVEDFITEAVGQALQEKPAIPQAHAPRREEPAAENEQGTQVDIKNLLHTMRQDADVKEETFTYDASEGVRTGEPDDSIGTSPAPAEIAEPSQTGKIQEAGVPDRCVEETIASKCTSDPERAPEEHSSEKKGSTLEITDLNPIGTVFQTYIVASEGETMYLIDQHAAHERVFYERLLRQYHSGEKLSQQMLVPIQISVSADVEYAEDSWIGYLRDMGYDIENFGARTYIVRAMPAFAVPGEGEAFLREMLLGLEHAPDIHSFAGLDRLIMRSCKSAVKGGDDLHPEEIQALLYQLAECENPWSCPHGRPTMIRMRKQELERMFKR